MAEIDRVRNPETHCKLKLKKAMRMHEQCIIELDMGTMTYRNLTLAQIMQKRAQQSHISEPIPFAEIPGLIYQPAERNLAQTRASYELLAQANRFCLEHAPLN